MAAKTKKIGAPTEPDKANLTKTEKEALKVETGSPAGPNPVKNLGMPTDPERGGVTDKDLQIAGSKKHEDAFPEAEEIEPGRPPSITGNEGVITEPKRGGVNKLEEELEGVKKPAKKAAAKKKDSPEAA